jgi:hypothetical protein
LLGQLDVEEDPSGLCALDGNKDSNKHRGMLRATRALLGKAPDKLTGVNGTGAYCMETRGLKRESHSRYVARGVSVVVALLLCLGIFLLPLPATGSEVPSALATANLPSPDLATNGNPHPLEETYKYPLNAELLTMLLLALSFGLSVGWLLRNAQRQRTLCSLAGVRSSFATICEDLPFLGVFRL